MFFYLSYLPFTSTGLYAIFKKSSTAAIARENSLKLLDSQVLKYAYSLMVSALAPLLAVMLGILLTRDIRRRNLFSVPIHIFLFLLLCFAVSMTGARIAVVNLLIVMALALFFRKGLPFKPTRSLLLLLLFLIPPAIFSILREGGEIGLAILFEYLGYLARRTFVMPLNVASWYVHYSQINGIFGITSLPKLSSILGIAPLNVPNIIGLVYSDGSKVTSTTAGAGYLFTYYAYFGLTSLLFSIIGLWFLDVALLVYERLSNVMLLPCVAAASLSILSFISSDYTVVWLTHGFGVILLFSLLIDRFIVPKTDNSNFLSGQGV